MNIIESFKGKRPNLLPTGNIIYSGSFNPLHEGHIATAKYVHDRFNTRVDFEISVNNIDKGTVSWFQISERIEHFKKNEQPWFGNLWITDLGKFVDKAAQFPLVTFVVGFDVFYRIFGPEYRKDFDTTKTILEDFQVKWLVFPRYVNGEITKKEEFDQIPEEIMNKTSIVWDYTPINISSTEIRNKLRRTNESIC